LAANAEKIPTSCLIQSPVQHDFLHLVKFVKLQYYIKLKSAWFCALSKIFDVKGSDVDFISEMCERYCFETDVANRRARFCRKL